MIGAVVLGAERVSRNLERAARAVAPASFFAVEKAGLYLEGQLKKNRLSGGKRSAVLQSRGFVYMDSLRVGTGHLRASVHSRATWTRSNAVANVGTPIFYAKVHEEGCVIVPRTKPYLRFKVGKTWVATKRVVIPARRIFWKEARTSQPKIKEIIGEAATVVARIGNGGQ